MLTRRENLLVRPWQERSYIQHRLKVESARAVVDNRAPPRREHVMSKLKKAQLEKERCLQVVADNFILHHHLGRITRTSRVDHVWAEPPPNFLNRVGIYSMRRRSSVTDRSGSSEDWEPPKNRKERCYGCSPQRYRTKEQIPEERIPFEPPKKRTSRKLQSPPEFELNEAETQDEEKPRRIRKKKTEKLPEQEKDSGGEKKKKMRYRRHDVIKTPKSLFLTRGNVTLQLAIPTDTELIYNDRGQEKRLSTGLCHCSRSYRP